MRFAALLASVLLGSVSAVVGTAVISTAAIAGPPTTARTAPTAPMAPRAPTASSPTDTQIAKPPSLKSCNQAADAKSLTGKQRATFVKDCQAGNPPPEG